MASWLQVCSSYTICKVLLIHDHIISNVVSSHISIIMLVTSYLVLPFLLAFLEGSHPLHISHVTNSMGMSLHSPPLLWHVPLSTYLYVSRKVVCVFVSCWDFPNHYSPHHILGIDWKPSMNTSAPRWFHNV
jgi:hypothetical protein